MRVQICCHDLARASSLGRGLAGLAEHLLGAGFEVGLVCCRSDPDLAARFGGRLEVLDTAAGAGVAEVEAVCRAAMARSWAAQRPDVVVAAGWPFLTAAAAASAEGVGSLVVECGTPPELPGPPDGEALREWRRIRAETLPRVDGCLSASDFIRDTQSLDARGSEAGLRTVRPGSDHLAAASGDLSAAARADLARLDALRADAAPLLVALGADQDSGAASLLLH
ncbi:glycosyltransferase, partial [Enterovirga sp.]|uniref:glycosyltransferase n=1 Tax=Enterovirga sp. TaxID=2026350 RepID=UPI002612C492